MHTFIIAALTADGFIGQNDGHFTDWTSKEDKQFFAELTTNAGVIIVGANTYRTFQKPLKNRLNIVYTSRPETIEPHANVRTTSLPPDKLIQELMEAGHPAAAVIGGASINRQFMELGLVDTLYLTYEPMLFGQGIHLFDQPLNTKLSLKQVHTLSPQSIVHEYQVIK